MVIVMTYDMGIVIKKNFRLATYTYEKDRDNGNNISVHNLASICKDKKAIKSF